LPSTWNFFSLQAVIAIAAIANITIFFIVHQFLPAKLRKKVEYINAFRKINAVDGSNVPCSVVLFREEQQIFPYLAAVSVVQGTLLLFLLLLPFRLMFYYTLFVKVELHVFFRRAFTRLFFTFGYTLFCAKIRISSKINKM